MLKLLGLLAVIGAMAATAVAQSPSPAPQRPAGYDRLQVIAGRWTVEGREKTFVETCDWFEGRFLMLCRSESTRKDGHVVRGMSLLGYLPDEDVYTYHGFDSSGRNETLRGRWAEGLLEYTGEAQSEGKLVKTRVRMGPFGGKSVDFVAESSTDGGQWVLDGRMKYLRLP